MTKRFGQYFVADLRSVCAAYGLNLALMTALPVLLYVFIGLVSFVFGGGWHGPSFAFRLMAFAVALIATCMSFPSRCYGKVTDRRAGANYILLPVSTTEKTASMLIIGCIIVPLVFVFGYCLLDSLVCLMDSRCGKPLFSATSTLVEVMYNNNVPVEIMPYTKTLCSPLLYFDDVIQLMLTFLLGALYFKKNKVVKTVLAMIVVSTTLGMLSSSLLYHGIQYSLDSLVEKYSWIFEHLALVDTVSDTVVNVGLTVWIYFRLKTIKY